MITGCALMMGSPLYATETNRACYTLGTSNNGTVPGVRLSETDDHHMIAIMENVQMFHGQTYGVKDDPVRVVKVRHLYPGLPTIYEGENFFLQIIGNVGTLRALDANGRAAEGTLDENPTYCDLAPKRQIIEAQGELNATVACDLDLPDGADEGTAKARAVANAKAQCGSDSLRQLTDFAVHKNCETKPYTFIAKALFQCFR